ncbi:MAG: c-type cytochrome biogenesis protein CcsB [Coriobacteriia bacterium]
MDVAQSVTFWAAVVSYVAAFLLLSAGVLWKREGLARWARVVASAGVAAHAAAVVVRWVAASHFPYVRNYENLLVGTFCMALAWVAASWRWRGLWPGGVLVLPFVLLTLGYALTQPAELSPVTPPYQSAWLVVHVTFAWFTYASYSVVAGLAAAHLLRLRAEKKGAVQGLLARIPPEKELGELSMRLVAFGFLNNAVMIASGAIWAYRLWGAYWRWDPVETWSLLTWLAYGFYMHARLTLRWSGKRLAWVALFALFGVMMSFWGVQFAPTTYHLFQDIGGTLIETGRMR